MSSASVVADVNDVQRLAVLSVLADVVEHLADGPVFTNRDVVRRHQTPDRILRISEQRDGNGALCGREQRQQLTGGGGGQLFEEARAIVGRHFVEQRGDFFLAHRLQQRFLRSCGRYSNTSAAAWRGQHAEGDHLILETELGEDLGEVARMAVPDHVPET